MTLAPPPPEATVAPPPPPPPPPAAAARPPKRARVISKTQQQEEEEEEERGPKWSKEEDARLMALVREHGPKGWTAIAHHFALPRRNHMQCLHRWSKVLNPEIRKGPWTPEEDAILLKHYTGKQGKQNWQELAERVPGRIGKQVRERVMHHLRDGICKDAPWTLEEDRAVMLEYAYNGGKWAKLARALPGRTDNSVKNRFHSSLKKRMTQVIQERGAHLQSLEELVEQALLLLKEHAKAKEWRTHPKPLVSKPPAPKALVPKALVPKAPVPRATAHRAPSPVLDVPEPPMTTHWDWNLEGEEQNVLLF